MSAWGETYWGEFEDWLGEMSSRPCDWVTWLALLFDMADTARIARGEQP